MDGVSNTNAGSNQRVAIIGAGLSGLIAATSLNDQGIQTTVFEKSRGTGGRMSTRRVDEVPRFDHGAQYFTIRSDEFKQFVNEGVQQGFVAPWPEDQRFVVLNNGRLDKESSPRERFVGVPAMNSMCKHLGNNIDIRKNTRVAHVSSLDQGLALADEHGHVLGVFQGLIVSAPAGQTAELLSGVSFLAETARKVAMCRCWAAMISLDPIERHEWVGAFVEDSFINWIARNDSKPGRPKNSADFVVHTDHDFAVRNWERDSVEVSQRILGEFWKVTGFTERETNFLAVHRWKFAKTEQPATVTDKIDFDTGIAICGDWTQGDRVEGAFLSGLQAAQLIQQGLASRRK